MNKSNAFPKGFFSKERPKNCEYIFSTDDMYAVDMRRFDELTELIRCKDCKWADWYTADDGRTSWYCYETGKDVNGGDDFCSQAERAER